jgi:hypothetical protein
MKILLKYFFVLFVMFSFNNCTSQKISNNTNYDFKTECMGTELDGSLTLKAWGKGRNYFDASTQAKKNAVRDVIFKGISKGASSCSKDPLLVGPRTETRHEDYFYKFFADGGEYEKYVSLKDEKLKNKIKRDKKKQSESVTRLVVVRVKRYDLKQKLKTDLIKNY